MVEPLFVTRFDSTPKVGDALSLTGAEAKHAISVRRMRVGEAIQFTDGSGLRVRGEVAGIEGNQLAMKVNSVTTDSQPATQITLVQALAKGDRDELAIQAATELGVSGIVPWESERSISKWIGTKEAKGVERWQTIVNEAAKQSLRAYFPEVAKPIQATQVQNLVNDFDAVLVLDPTAESSIVDFSFKDASRIALVVGPEGGISEAELIALESAGAKRVHLGDSILRTSTAGVAAIAAIAALTGQWAAKSAAK